ncbi:hypothetical protein AALB_3543 [Agarivorans albus MKT 106]|uniref:Uncharacterized protein n=1 Tax=Agarivorans albus MKT 106 TaxID=1331007 RepID=R9PQA5_AGAAL|nr:hypothetical protein AALB_3543 [Agarivorans albus MKT 106]
MGSLLQPTSKKLLKAITLNTLDVLNDIEIPKLIYQYLFNVRPIKANHQNI